MSLLLALLRWLFGRRFQAADHWRLQRADYAAYMLTEILEGGVLWENPEDRAWLLRNLALIEDAAFCWAPRRCRVLGEAMGYGLSLEAVYVRLEEARAVLLGPSTEPILGKSWKRRRGRKFVQRKKLVAWRAKWRRFAKVPLHRAARGPPPPCGGGRKPVTAGAAAVLPRKGEGDHRAAMVVGDLVSTTQTAPETLAARAPALVHDHCRTWACAMGRKPDHGPQRKGQTR